MTLDEGIWRANGLVFDGMAANVATMRPLIRLILIVAALAYGALPFASMAAAMPAMQQGQHSGHGDPLNAQPDDATAMAHAPSGADCPRHTKADVNGHCAACLALPAFLRLNDAMAFAAFVPRAALAAALVSKNAAPLVPPPRA